MSVTISHYIWIEIWKCRLGYLLIMVPASSCTSIQSSSSSAFTRTGKMSSPTQESKTKTPSTGSSIQKSPKEKLGLSFSVDSIIADCKRSKDSNCSTNVTNSTDAVVISTTSPLKTSTSFSVDGILSKTSPIPSAKIVTEPPPNVSPCSPFAALSQDAKWAQTMAASFPWLSAANLSPPPSKYLTIACQFPNTSDGNYC